jgi:hypothetical protein
MSDIPPLKGEGAERSEAGGVEYFTRKLNRPHPAARYARVHPPPAGEGSTENRDRGESHDSSPPTPPDIRVPYPAVRRIERTPAPAEGVAAEVWKPTTAKALRSLLCRAVRLHRSASTCRTDITACLPRGVFESCASTPRFHPFGPSVGWLRLLCPLLTSALRSDRLATSSVSLPRHSADLPR